MASYSHHPDHRVGEAAVEPQTGGFYGGWITPDLAGQFKGNPAAAIDS